MEKLPQSLSGGWRYIRLPHGHRAVKLCCNGCQSLVSGPNTVSACCDSLCSEREAQVSRAAHLPLQTWIVAVVWFPDGFGLKCSCCACFGSKPHRSSKQDLKHRSFDEHTTMKLHIAIRSSPHVHTHGKPGRNSFAGAASVPVLAEAY